AADVGRVEMVEAIAADDQQPRPLRAAEPLVRAAGQVVDAERLEVDRERPDRLRAVEQHLGAVRVCGARDLHGRRALACFAGDVAERGELRPGRERRLEVGERLARVVGEGEAADDDAFVGLQRERRVVDRRVLLAADQQLVARLEWESTEHEGDTLGAVARHRDLGLLGVDQPGEALAARGHLVHELGSLPVAVALEAAERVEVGPPDRLGHDPLGAAVHVDDVLQRRQLGADRREVVGCACGHWVLLQGRQSARLSSSRCPWFWGAAASRPRLPAPYGPPRRSVATPPASSIIRLPPTMSYSPTETRACACSLPQATYAWASADEPMFRACGATAVMRFVSRLPRQAAWSRGNDTWTSIPGSGVGSATRIGLPLSLAPAPRAASNVSPRIGSCVTLSTGRPSTSSVMQTANTFIPPAKFAVPSSGSTIHTRFEAPAVIPCSSPLIASFGNCSAIRARMCVSAARSAAVTGSAQPFMSTTRSRP